MEAQDGEGGHGAAVTSRRGLAPTGEGPCQGGRLAYVSILGYTGVMERRGFKEARILMLQALEEGRIQHEPRSVLSEKNLLATGEVDTAFVVRLIRGATGQQARWRPHHQAPDVQVWVLKPWSQGRQWYLKTYLLDDLWFISVHLAIERRL